MQNRLLAVLAVVLLMLATGTFAFGQDQHVRWDIISVDFTTTPNPINPGGFADAIAPNNGGRIRLTGSGTFDGNGGVTGGGTWDTFDGNFGTYQVTSVVIFVQANFQMPPPDIDNIGNPAEASNGYVLLQIVYDDGSQGVLGVFCHGPGAPNGIAEGFSATKGSKTYVEVQGPAPLIDANRTLFHVSQQID